MLPKKKFQEALRVNLEKNTRLNHPVFAELFSGKKEWDLLKLITLEGYQITKYFLVYIENLFYHCPLEKYKLPLLHNLYEEYTGRLSKTKNHVELMKDFIRAQGISDEEREAFKPSPATQELINYRLDGCTNPTKYHIGAASVAIASEGQSLETRAGKARHEILAGVYGLPDESTLFFSVHQAEDIGHVATGIKLVADICSTAEMQEEALFAVEHTCNLFYGMYESVGQRWAEIKAARETQKAV